MNVVVICGHNRSGKTTIAEYLSVRGWTPLAFAQPLKQMAAIIAPADYESDIKDHMTVYGDKTARDVLIGLAGAVQGVFGKPVFANIVAGQIGAALQNNQRIVVSDCRFEWEVDSLAKYNPQYFVVVRDRGQHPIVDYIKSQGYSVHCIENNGDFAELYENVDKNISAISS